MNSFILQGGGEHARVVLDALLASGHSVQAIFDPKNSGSIMDVPQRGPYQPEFEKSARAIVAIGDNALRKRVVGQTKHAFGQVIHPSAVVSTTTQIGDGTMVLHGVIVQAFAVIGKHVILNTGSRVDHDCKLGDYVHVAPGAILCGTVEVGEGALIGAGSVVLPGRRIGAWAVVGAGSVVTHNVPDNAVVKGNPARSSVRKQR